METERLILRPWGEGDVDVLYKYASDPAVMEPAGWDVHADVEESLRVIRETFSTPETYAVVPKNVGHPVGGVSLRFGNNSYLVTCDTEGELGYWIGQEFWGQGLIPEAARELIRYAFEELKLEKIWCGHLDGNKQSNRVQEKLGFHPDHFSWWLSDDGELTHTEYVSCLTRGDWEKQQQSQ